MAFGITSLSRNILKTNSTTPVTAVASPSSGITRSVRTIYIYNADTAPATFTLSVVVSSTVYAMYSVTLPVGSTYEFGESSEFVVLTSTDSVQVVLSGAITTNQLNIIASYGDYSS